MGVQSKMDPSRIVRLEMHKRHLISGAGVTLLDANHCPGAVMFLFEVPRRQPAPDAGPISEQVMLQLTSALCP